MHPGALAAGTLPQYNTAQGIFVVLISVEGEIEPGAAGRLCSRKNEKEGPVIYFGISRDLYSKHRGKLQSEKFKQDTQCTYDVTLRRVRVTVISVEKQWVLHNLSRALVALGIQYAMRLEPYCHLWPTPLYNKFPHFVINVTIFKKNVTGYTMWVLISSTTFVWNISHSKKNWARYDKKCTLVFV